MSNPWKDKDKRKGLITTFIFHGALLVIFMLFGLKYYEPKPEDGIVINFGNSETGFGSNESGAQPTASPKKQESPKLESPVKSEENQTPVKTQDVIETPSIDTKSSQQQEEEIKEPEPEPEPQPSDALKQMLEATKNSKEGGEGVSKGAGDQGQEDGDKNSNNRSGSGGGGSGGDGNYMLGGRSALQKPKPKYPCTDEGRVVVKIYVNREGKVERANAGERIPNGAATTTTSSCLYQQAEAAALKTTWQSDSGAPDLQIGYIVYNFSKK